jgi:hypothetical protein
MRSADISTQPFVAPVVFNPWVHPKESGIASTGGSVDVD